MAGTCCRRRTRKRGAPVRWPRRLNVGDANFGWYGALGHTSSTGVCMGDGRVCCAPARPSNRNGFCCLPWPPPGRCGRQTSDRGCGRRLAATSEPNSFSSFNTWMSTVAERWTPIRLKASPQTPLLASLLEKENTDPAPSGCASDCHARRACHTRRGAAANAQRRRKSHRDARGA